MYVPKKDYKKIGGKWFKYASAHPTKKEALRIAQRERGYDQTARVFKLSKPFGRFKYTVYVSMNRKRAPPKRR